MYAIVPDLITETDELVERRTAYSSLILVLM